MLFDLGMNRDNMEDVTKVKQKIQELDQQFELVMIMEKFDESVIILKDMLCWDIDDVIYLMKKTGGHERQQLLRQHNQTNN